MMLPRTPHHSPYYRSLPPHRQFQTQVAGTQQSQAVDHIQQVTDVEFYPTSKRTRCAKRLPGWLSNSNYDNSNRPAESLHIPLQLWHRLEPHTSHPCAHSANFLTQHPPNRLIHLHHLHHLRPQHPNPQLLRRGLHCNRVRHRAASFNLAVYAYMPPRRVRRTKHPIVVIVINFVRSNSTRDC